MIIPKYHQLKLESLYASIKKRGKKTFEIRKNDRDFKEGDIVTYIVPENESLNEFFRRRLFVITYVTSYEQKEGFVVFAEQELAASGEAETKPGKESEK